MMAAMIVKTAMEKIPMRTILRFQGICAMYTMMLGITIKPRSDDMLKTIWTME
jgi:hypothetical protein